MLITAALPVFPMYTARHIALAPNWTFITMFKQTSGLLPLDVSASTAHIELNVNALCKETAWARNIERRILIHSLKNYTGDTRCTSTTEDMLHSIKDAWKCTTVYEQAAAAKTAGSIRKTL